MILHNFVHLIDRYDRHLILKAQVKGISMHCCIIVSGLIFRVEIKAKFICNTFFSPHPYLFGAAVSVPSFSSVLVAHSLVEQLIIDSAWLPLLTTLLHAIFSVMPFERFECSFIMPVLLSWCSSHISILSPAFLGIRSCLDLKIAWRSISANSAVTPVFPSVQSRTKNSHLSH